MSIAGSLMPATSGTFSSTSGEEGWVSSVCRPWEMFGYLGCWLLMLTKEKISSGYPYLSGSLPWVHCLHMGALHPEHGFFCHDSYTCTDIKRPVSISHCVMVLLIWFPALAWVPSSESLAMVTFTSAEGAALQLPGALCGSTLDARSL